MNHRILTPATCVLALLLSVSLLRYPESGRCQTKTVKAVKKPVSDAIAIGQKAQKQRDQWETERAQLIVEYEQLRREHAYLEKENQRLASEKAAQEAITKGLEEKQRQALEIQRDLLPFLEGVLERLDTMVATDTPFLKEERTERLKILKSIMADPVVTLASKYRKIMEALFVEAEYGNTIEVYQEKVRMNGEEVLGNIFRLGRISLFFLSLDQTAAAAFNVAEQAWQPLSGEHLMAVRSAVEIGTKRKSAELLSLPLGRLAAGEVTE